MASRAFVFAFFGLLVANFLSLSSCVSSCPDEETTCGEIPPSIQRPGNILDEPSSPGVFHSLTVAEINAVRQFLEGDIGLASPENATFRDPHVFMMDLELPEKAQVLNFLDHDGSRPDRHARVTLFRGDLQPPVVQEVVCGPLPNVTSCRLDLAVPFSVRPIESREYDLWENHLIKEIHRLFGHIIRESYGGSFDYENCESDCMSWWDVPVGSNVYRQRNETYIRRSWVWPRYSSLPHYYSTFPVDMAFLCNVDGVDETKFSVEKVWYSGRLYDDPDQFIVQYAQGNIPKTQIPYPTAENTKFASLESREETPSQTGPYQRPPEMIEPDGKRYSVLNEKVEYMNMWTFSYRVSPISGTALYDIRYRGDRLAFEISLMDIAVIYAGDAPMPRMTSYVDSAWLIGARSKALVPGADCPTTATLIPLTVTSQSKTEPAEFPSAICIFEQNSGQPLRRHHSHSKEDGAFYGGMLDSALIVRSIFTVYNYDYVVDFKFHHNGAMGVNVLNAGFAMTSFYNNNENPYGPQLQDNIMAPMHFHGAHFKVDLDIGGTLNRYETLDIVKENIILRNSNGRRFSQSKTVHTLKTSEKDAKFRYDYDTPKFHLFHNDGVRNRFGERRAYRLHHKGIAKLMDDEDIGNEAAHAWTRHQMSVTKRKETEWRSSSMYNQWETTNPVVDFRTFSSNDDSIVDEDLVAWVSLGMYHLTHTEDFPTTPTAGVEQSFYLLPYNYFPECPSMKSPDSVFIKHANLDRPEDGLVFDLPGSVGVNHPPSMDSCRFVPLNVSEPYIRDPNSIFESTYDKGV